MRLLFLLVLFVSCSSPLRYKHSFHRNELNRYTQEDVQVAKVEIDLKNSKLLASGMDTTIIRVRLLDKSGNEVTKVDPSDLTLSTSEDLEAKPFALKQGVYKAQILPRAQSPNVLMQVDWLDRVRSPIVSLNMTTAPIKVSLKPVTNEFPETKSFGEVMVTRTIASDQTESFSFTNVGENNVIKNNFSSRTFSFDYPEQARQNVSLEIDDAPNDKVSHTMHSLFMFFPRKQLPIVEQLTGELRVTLSTGEKILFNKETKEIIGGVLVERALDYSKDHTKRYFPDIKYIGKGIMIRVNARGRSPQIQDSDNSKIELPDGLKGSREVLIVNGSTGQRCRRPKSEFWEPMDVRPIEFKFPSDKDLDTHLRVKCGFGLPKL